MLEILKQRLAGVTPRQIAGSWPEAAVLIPLTDEPDPQIILTRRASHLSSHQGQVAFPGGKRDPGDADLSATALRETEEEIALPASKVQLVGRLDDLLSLHGLKVRPYVGLVAADAPLQANTDELDVIFRVPLNWLLQDPRTHTDVITVGRQTYYVPSYQYQEFTLWGLSAMMLVELLKTGFDQPLDLLQKPEGRLVQRPVRPLPIR